MIGICLGAQMIASVLKAKVKSNLKKEIGWFPVNFDSKACQNIGIPFKGELMCFHWHGETFDLPHDATLLASSAACKNQAFAIGNTVFGFQFHLEANKFSVERLIFNCENELDGSEFVQSKGQLLAHIPYSTDSNKILALFLDELDIIHFKRKQNS